MRPAEISEKGIVILFWWCILEEIPQEDKAMTQYKAQKTGFTTYGKYSNFVEYEYRGKKYEVEFPVCNSKVCTSAKIQHEDAQARIDRELDNTTSNKEQFNAEDIWTTYGWN